MGKQLVAISGDRPWTRDEIEAGKNRERFKPDETHNPLPALQTLRNWWQGKINVRMQFRQEDLDRAGRLRAYIAPRIQHDEDASDNSRAASPAAARDVAFAVYVGIRECFALAAEHDARITEYQRRMAECGG